MSLIPVFLLAIGLSMDAFAVALATGISLCIVSRGQLLRLALTFGLFQAGMPIIGWLAGSLVHKYIEAYDHWAAFALLSFVGAKMLYDAFTEDEEEGKKSDPTTGLSLLLLAVATSIDAMAVGLSFALMNESIWLPAVVIGIVCTICTYGGMRLGCLVGKNSRLGVYATVLGGIILVGLGINILREHGVFFNM